MLAQPPSIINEWSLSAHYVKAIARLITSPTSHQTDPVIDQGMTHPSLVGVTSANMLHVYHVVE